MRAVSIVFVVLAVIGLSAAWSQRREGQPCHHYSQPCRDAKLIKEEVQQCPSSTCRGPNVCRARRTYTKHYYSAVYRNKCHTSYSYWYRRYIQYCQLKCVLTDSCSVTRNVTRNAYECCDGFTTNTTGPNQHHYWYRRNSWYLRKYGCPRVLLNSTLDCLVDLGVTAIASLFQRTELGSQLGNDSAPTPKFTIFAAPNEIITNSQIGSLPTSTLSIILGSHVVRREIHSAIFYSGLRKKTTSPGRFIHVSEVYTATNSWFNSDADTYINGHELIGPDACVARNGIVHIIGGVIDSTDQSIAEVVQDSSSLSSLESLLTKANLLRSLNRTHGFLTTLFAPTNTAFERGSSSLSVDIVRCLSADQHSSELRLFLKYHLTCDAHYSPVLAKRTMVTTEACRWVRSKWYRWGYRQCKKLTITVNDDGIGVGETGSMVSQANIPASNGVIHEVSLPLINPWLNLTQLCANFSVTPNPNATINVLRPTVN